MLTPRPRSRRRRLSDDGGFSMIAVLMAVFIAGLFVAGAYAAVDEDYSQARRSQDRKQAYAAAEAGITFYTYQLQKDQSYWTKCTNVADPNPSDATDPIGPNGATGTMSPISQQFTRTSPTQTDPRTWRRVPGSTAQYAIELLPAPGSTSCVQGQQYTMLDSNSGSFRIRATGRINGISRSIIRTYSYPRFLDYVYYTDYETLDPAAETFANAQSLCSAYRASRASACTDIVFANADKILGPLHTNDDLLICGAPTFGRDAADRIEITGPGTLSNGAPTGWSGSSNCSGNSPNFVGTRFLSANKVDMPTTNSALKTNAAANYLYTGKTTIRLTSDGNMTVTNVAKGWTNKVIAQPANGVIYAQAGASCTSRDVPTNATYGESDGCANIYLSGTYTQNLTIAAENDIIVKPTGSSATDGDLTKSGDVVLGLIANNYVRVYHPITTTYDGSGNITGYVNASSFGTVTIEAAILNLQHSFIVDNYDKGAHLGYLNVTGAIAQKFRGPVGRGTAGYTKNYVYDDRLRYRSPPYFLDPTNVTWYSRSTHEQVPATT